MRVLLDECVHAGVRKAFAGHRVSTVPQAGWSGINNGRLLALIGGNFDVFVTVDQNLRHQQSLAGLPFAIVFVSVPDNTLAAYVPLFDLMLRTVDAARPGDIAVIP
jgi:hypothetical protein